MLIQKKKDHYVKITANETLPLILFGLKQLEAQRCNDSDWQG